jgi:hypothetical protein
VTELVGRGRQAGPAVWLVRLASVAIFGYALLVAWRKFGGTAEQEELQRYVELQVPVYLEQMARVHALLDRLGQAPGPSPAEARTLLVDQAMPLLVQARQRAAAVESRAPSVKARNDEYLVAVDRLIEACRAGVRAIDDTALSAEEGHRMVRERRRAADDSLRAWIDHLRETCTRAGLHVDPARRAAPRAP